MYPVYLGVSSVEDLLLSSELYSSQYHYVLVAWEVAWKINFRHIFHLIWHGMGTIHFVFTFLDCVRLLNTPGKTTRRSVKMLKSPLSPQLKRQTSSSGRIQDHVLKSSNNPKLLGNKICCWKLYVCLCFLSVIYYLSSCFFFPFSFTSYLYNI